MSSLLYKYPFQTIFPTFRQMSDICAYRFKSQFYSYVEKMITFFTTKLNNPLYLSLLNDYTRTNENFQEELVSLVGQYNPITNPIPTMTSNPYFLREMQKYK